MALKFLTTDELRIPIYTQFIDSALKDFETRVEEIEAQNIALISSKLNGRYDTNLIFETTGSDRNKVIIKILTALVIYELISANAARKIPENFEVSYERNMKWLNDIRDGKENPDLPVLENPDLPNIIHGTTQNNNWYL